MESVQVQHIDQSGVRRWWFPITFAILAVITLLWIYTRANDFSIDYHPDEGGKVNQVISGRRNYRHPQLMLEVATIVSTIKGERPILGTREDPLPEDEARVVTTGRSVSAGFAAAAVVVLALTAYRAAGGWAMAITAACVGLCAPLIVNAHYMKEDASLVFGVSLMVSALYHVWSTRDADSQKRAWAAALFGGACAAAVSGKYVGITLAVPAMAVVLLAAPTKLPASISRRNLAKAALLGFVLVLMVVNWRIAKKPAAFAKSLTQQTREGISEHKGLTIKKPSAYFAEAVWEETVPAVRVLAAAGLIQIAYMAWKRQPWLSLLPIAAAYYLVLMSFASMPNHRYILPVTVLIHAMAATSIVLAMYALRRRRLAFHAIGAVAVIGLLAIMIPPAKAIDREFANDSRDRVAQWLADNLPAGEVLWVDHGVQLPRPPSGRPIETKSLLEATVNPDVNTRVKYVLVCDLQYDRFFSRYIIPADAPKAVEDFERRKTWYERLFASGKVLWKSEPEYPTYAITNPTIRVYQVTTPPAVGASE